MRVLGFVPQPNLHEVLYLMNPTYLLYRRSSRLPKKRLQDFGIEFFAKPKRNMKNKWMRLNAKLLARRRAIIETVIDQLTNISQIKHFRHRSLTDCMVN